MKTEERFVGDGNINIGEGRQRGWQVTCAQCGATKVVTSNRGSMMPPFVIMKKLVQTGWYIGHKAADDLCVNCRRHPRRKTNGAAPVQPTAPAADRELPSLRTALEHARQALLAERYDLVAESLDIAMLQLNAKPVETQPVQPATKPVKPAPPKEEPDTDYESWLKSLPKESK